MVLFIICIPLFLLSGNIRWVANDLQFYEDGFENYDVSGETGFSDAELIDISKGLIDYFNYGEIDDTMDIFSEEEVIHLRDVRGLIQLSYVIQWTTLGYIIVFIAAGFAFGRKRFFHTFITGVAAGSIAGIMGVALTGIAALIDFDWLFIAFHRLFFTNDLWVSSGYLPRIYTEGFFYDAAKFIAIATVLESAFIGLIAGFFILRRRKRLAD
jgi:integral membrane protein (TIGR01906 family)